MSGAPSGSTGAVLFFLDEAAIMGLTVALATAGAPSPAVVGVPIGCQAFVLAMGDPVAWSSAADSWGSIRDVTTIVAADLTNAKNAISADSWSDDGAVEFGKYCDRIAGAVGALNDLVDATAQQCAALSSMFLQAQVEFLLAITGAIVECIAANFEPDPTMTTQTIIKTVIVGVFLALLTVLVLGIVGYINTISSAKQAIGAAYDKLAGQLHDANGNLSAGAAALSPDRMAVIANPREWKLSELEGHEDLLN